MAGRSGGYDDDEVEESSASGGYEESRHGETSRSTDRPAKTKSRRGRRMDRDGEPTLSATAAALAGARHIRDLTGQEPARVTSLEPHDDGWVVGVEVIDHHRIPSSTDILALYEAKLDLSGELLAYNRKRRYARGDSGGLP